MFFLFHYFPYCFLLLFFSAYLMVIFLPSIRFRSWALKVNFPLLQYNRGVDRQKIVESNLRILSHIYPDIFPCKFIFPLYSCIFLFKCKFIFIVAYVTFQILKVVASSAYIFCPSITKFSLSLSRSSLLVL